MRPGEDGRSLDFFAVAALHYAWPPGQVIVRLPSRIIEKSERRKLRPQACDRQEKVAGCKQLAHCKTNHSGRSGGVVQREMAVLLRKGIGDGPGKRPRVSAVHSLHREASIVTAYLPGITVQV